MLPKQRDVEIPLLQVLVELGGKGKPKEIYPRVTGKFPEITEKDLAETLPSGSNKWTNRIQWTRQALITRGEMGSPTRGVWAITEKGRGRLEQTPDGPSPPNFMELYEEYEASLRAKLLQRINDLSSREFELFARRLLQVYGFVDVEVTTVSADGGIDGHGRLLLGLAAMNVAFQCKRWQGNIGRPEVDRFRGAIQGRFEQGVFFTTSDFTPSATNASLRAGAAPIILLNGERIVKLMMEKELGVEREPLYVFYERPIDLLESEGE